MADAIADMERALRMLKDRGAEMAAFEATLQQISASLADIVGLMEKPDDMAGALAGLKFPEPKVSVTVQPAAVTVSRDAAGQSWRIELERPSPTAPIKSLLVTKL